MATPMVIAVKELWEQAILPCNLPLTVLLGLVVAFLSLKVLTGSALDSGDGDIDADGDPGDHGHFSMDLLRVVNAGTIPLTIVLSVLVLAMWMASILLNYYLNPKQDWLLSSGLFVGSLVIGAGATKLITQPLVPFMRRLKASEDTAPVIGETGVVRSMEIDSRYGQVEVPRLHGAPALLNSRLVPGIDPLSRGARVTIVSSDAATGIYLVKPVLTESNNLKS